MGNYKINDINVEILYSTRVIEEFATKDEVKIINKISINEKIDLTDLENHFDNIFKIIKSRVSEFKTYNILYDTIEYEDSELIWKSKFDEKLNLMEIEVGYSQMNDPNYQQSIVEAAIAFQEAQENGEDMVEWIKTHHEDSRRKGKKPLIAGMLPPNKVPSIH